MFGAWTMPRTPRTTSTRNHTTITGPNSLPIFSVPRLCMAKSPIRMTSVSGRMNGCSVEVSTPRPSTALSTDIAGVSMPSPKNSARPRSAATPMTFFTERFSFGERCASAASASTPPSPSLSARMISTTYLMVTTRISAQTMAESAPITAKAPGKAPPVARTDSRMA